MAEKDEKLLLDIEDTVVRLEALRDLAYAQYSQAVDAVLANQIVDEKQLEHLLDGIIDFGDDVRFIDLMKKLCRHIYFQYPQLVGDYVNMFRSLYVEKGEEDGVCDS